MKKTNNFTHTLLRISIGIVYLWFGILKFFPELSPAEELAKETISKVSANLMPVTIFYLVLALWETLIGVLLICNRYVKYTIWAAMVHMLCTFLPILFISDAVFTGLPFSLTLIGQYIMKNLVIISGLISIYPFEKQLGQSRYLKNNVEGKDEWGYQ